jgi:O-antigen/teichoic acid export membrane protein
MLFPLHTRVFNPEDFGVVSYLYVFVAFLNIVYTFGMETAFFRFANKPGADPQRIFNIAQSAVVGISLILSLSLTLLAEPVASGLSIEGKSHYIIWLAVIMFIDGAVAIPFARLRHEKKPLQFALARIANVVVLILLNVYFFVITYWMSSGEITFEASDLRQGSYGIEYVFLANLIANSFYLFFFLRMFVKWRLLFDKEISGAMFRYAYPVMVTGLAGITNEMFSRWALEWWLPENFYPGKNSMYAVGLFSSAYKYAILMNLGIQAFRYAAEPFFFSNANDKGSPQLFANVNHYFVIFLGLIFVFVSVNLDWLKFLVPADYYESLNVVPLLLLSYLLLGVYYNYSVWFKLTDKTQFGTFIMIGGTVITIGLNFLLIPLSGYVGSSWASVACYACMTVACALLGRKYYPIPYQYLSDAAYVLFAIGLYLISQLIQFENRWASAMMDAGTIAFYLLVVYLVEKKNWSHSLR